MWKLRSSQMRVHESGSQILPGGWGFYLIYIGVTFQSTYSEFHSDLHSKISLNQTAWRNHVETQRNDSNLALSGGIVVKWHPHPKVSLPLFPSRTQCIGLSPNMEEPCKNTLNDLALPPHSRYLTPTHLFSLSSFLFCSLPLAFPPHRLITFIILRRKVGQSFNQGDI